MKGTGYACVSAVSHIVTSSCDWFASLTGRWNSESNSKSGPAYSFFVQQKHARGRTIRKAEHSSNTHTHLPPTQDRSLRRLCEFRRAGHPAPSDSPRRASCHGRQRVTHRQGRRTARICARTSPLGLVTPCRCPGLYRGDTATVVEGEQRKGTDAQASHRRRTIGLVRPPAAFARRPFALITTTRRVPGTGGPVSLSTGIALYLCSRVVSLDGMQSRNFCIVQGTHARHTW